MYKYLVLILSISLNIIVNGEMWGFRPVVMWISIITALVFWKLCDILVLSKERHYVDSDQRFCEEDKEISPNATTP